MKLSIKIVFLILAVLQIVFITIYFYVFNGEISSNHQEWATFSSIFNGVTIAILTAVNVWVFYKISIIIENNTKERVVKSTLFEAQKIVTDIRVGRYNNLIKIVNEIKRKIVIGYVDVNELEILRMTLMNDFYSTLFFKHDKLGSETFIFNQTKTVIEEIKRIVVVDKPIIGVEGGVENKLFEQLTNLTNIVEIHILGQMLRGDGIGEYIENNHITIDSTFNYYDEFVRKLHKLSKEE